MLESIDTLSLSHLSKRLKWTKVRELLLFEPWNYSMIVRKRELLGERISESLNQLTDTPFKVTQKFVEDHCQTSEKI